MLDDVAECDEPTAACAGAAPSPELLADVAECDAPTVACAGAASPPELLDDAVECDEPTAACAGAAPSPEFLADAVQCDAQTAACAGAASSLELLADATSVDCGDIVVHDSIEDKGVIFLGCPGGSPSKMNIEHMGEFPLLYADERFSYYGTAPKPGSTKVEINWAVYPVNRGRKIICC